MRIATFNVQNLRFREDQSGAHFDGARDEIVSLSKLSAEARAHDRADRALTARLIAEADADTIALQEVFDQRTLDAFHDLHLAPLGCVYPHRICVPGNDGRRHLALMSRLPLKHVESHAALTYAGIGLTPPEGEDAQARVFRRDCLTATCGGVRLYVVHFKAPADAASLAVARLEAQALRTLIERGFADPRTSPWLVLGDLNMNDVDDDDVLAVLMRDFASDLGLRLPPAQRWTYFNAHYATYARPDRILASPPLASLCEPLAVWRRGMSAAADSYQGPRLSGVGRVRPRASDHAPLAVDLALRDEGRKAP